ncbi:diguanylate cyclase domain-containing protein [Primorskyibacter sp. S87]|uniref:diguanylate cyclase domain-containing protein n=1 Tax=Primorskyibacter sp. S87 TaxID=3415126 RepID=UPI003C7D07F5
MQGTILILDAVATNRIMLKVQLSAAWYHVVQSDSLDGILPLVRRCRPDLIVTSFALPDGDATDLRRLLMQDEASAGVPIIAITPQNDRATRLRALEAGVDDVLSQPLDDTILQARIRSLIRVRSGVEDLSHRNSGGFSGFSESPSEFVAPVTFPMPPARVALVTRSAATGAVWRARLRSRLPHDLLTLQTGDIQPLMSEPVPDAIVIELPDRRDDAALRLIADLRARSATRHSAVIAVPNPADPYLAADALDRGAHDVMTRNFCVDELALRLTAQLRQKAKTDHLRDQVRDDLRASHLDPMTGLHNRRFALPQLSRIARKTAEQGEGLAVMLVDLDHFKRINDRFGHPAGDAVLTEAAHRLRAGLGPADMIARVGGEEFMIVMPGATRDSARAAAHALCRCINGTPFRITGQLDPVPVTTSIGVVVTHPPCCGKAQEDAVSRLVSQADRALYRAKSAGRNQVTLDRSAA